MELAASESERRRLAASESERRRLVNWRLLDCFNLKTIVTCNIFLNL